LAHLAKPTHHLSISFSNVIYPLLEQKCIEGTRAESKYAITAIASLHSPDDQKFAKLCKVGCSSGPYSDLLLYLGMSIDDP